MHHSRQEKKQETLLFKKKGFQFSLFLLTLLLAQEAHALRFLEKKKVRLLKNQYQHCPFRNFMRKEGKKQTAGFLRRLLCEKKRRIWQRPVWAQIVENLSWPSAPTPSDIYVHAAVSSHAVASEWNAVAQIVAGKGEVKLVRAGPNPVKNGGIERSAVLVQVHEGLRTQKRF